MKSAKKNEIIYFQNASANSVFFLKEGKIRISKFNSTGAEFLIAILGPGEIFGEESITGNLKRKEVATAEENSLFCVMPEGKMKELLQLAPQLNFKFGEMMEARLEKIQKRLEDLTFKTNEERIIDFIREIASKSAKNPTGEIIIRNTLTHENIAKLTSTNRQIVSTVFSELKKKQVIDYNRKEIKVLKVEKLNRLSL